MARNKLTTTALAVAATLAVAYTGSAWYFGKQIEAAHRQIDERIAGVPYLKLVRHDYARELFGASETITLELTPAMFQAPMAAHQASAPDSTEAAADGDSDEMGQETQAEGTTDSAPSEAQTPATAPQQLSPVQISIKSVIKHGPFPGFETLAAGRAETTIVFDEALQKKIDAVFAGKPALTVNTLYGISGGGRSQISSPPFKAEQPMAQGEKKQMLSGEGLEMTVNFTKDFAQYDLKGSAPRFEVSDSTGARFVLAGLSLEADEKRVFDDEPLMYAGSGKYSLAELNFVPAQEGAPKISLKNLQYVGEAPLSGEYLDLIAKIGTDELMIDDQNYGPAHYDFSLKHINARKLATANRAMIALYAKPENMQDPIQFAEVMAPVKGPLLELVADDLQFSIDRLSFHTADGDAALSASLAMTGATMEDYLSPLTLLPKVDFAADLAFPASLIDQAQSAANRSADMDPEEILARKQATDQTLIAFVQQGYATNETGMVKTRITFKAGQLLVNGKPFNPLSLAGSAM